MTFLTVKRKGLGLDFSLEIPGRVSDGGGQPDG